MGGGPTLGRVGGVEGTGSVLVCEGGVWSGTASWNRRSLHGMWTVGGMRLGSHDVGDPSPARLVLCFMVGLPGEDFKKSLLTYYSYTMQFGDI